MSNCKKKRKKPIYKVKEQKFASRYFRITYNEELKNYIPQCSWLLNASLKYTININDLWVDETGTIVVKVHSNVYIECR